MHDDPIANLDQMLASIRDYARLMASYYAALVEENVPPTVATQLVLSYQRTILEGATHSENDDED